MKMSDDTLLPPYRLAPGQNITLVSRYDSSVDHFGAAASSSWLSSPHACTGLHSACISLS